MVRDRRMIRVIMETMVLANYYRSTRTTPVSQCKYEAAINHQSLPSLMLLIVREMPPLSTPASRGGHRSCNGISL